MSDCAGGAGGEHAAAWSRIDTGQRRGALLITVSQLNLTRQVPRLAVTIVTNTSVPRKHISLQNLDELLGQNA